MQRDVRSVECERTRQRISAALDGELSPFERAHVAAHVSRCDGCSTFETQILSAAVELRSTPLERMHSGVHLPLSRRPVWGMRADWWAPLRVARLGTTAAVMVTVFLVALASWPQSLGSEQAFVADSLAQTDETNALVVQVRRPTLARGEQQVLAYGTGGIGAYKPPLAPTS